MCLPSLYFFYCAEAAAVQACAALDALMGVDDMGLLHRTGNSSHRTQSGALGAAAAELRIDLQGHQGLALAGRTLFVHHMGQVFVAEVFQGAADRRRSRFSQAAEGCLGDGGGKLLQKLNVLQGAPSLGDTRLDLQHPLGTLPAGNAFAAGFILGEVHEEPGHLYHTALVVHDHQAAGADHGPHLF